MRAATEISQLKSTPPAAAHDRLLHRLQLLLVFLPVLLTFLYIHSLAIELPVQDDWDLYVPAMQHLASGNLHWSDINAQHNESLVPFPVIAALLTAKLSGGRLLAIVYVSYLFICGTLAMLFLMFRTIKLPGRWSVLWFLPASLLFLGWRQSEGLLWSTHLLNSMALFFVIAAMYCCLRVAQAPIYFLAAIACASIASFSMASGILVWLCGAVALLIAGSKDMAFEQVLRYIVGWVAMAGLCVGCFFMDIAPHPVPWPSGVGYVLAHPFDAVHYALVYLGSPLAATSDFSPFIGTAFLLIAVPVLLLALKNFRRDGVLPGLLLAGYVGMALAPLLMGRLGLGVGQAYSSRYVTVGALAPLGVYFCSLSLMRFVPAARYLAGAMVVLMVVAIFNSYSAGLADGRKDWIVRSGCAAAVRDFHNVNRQRLACGYPDPGVVLERAPWLERYQLSLFAR